MATNHSFSAGVAMILTITTIAVGQLFKEQLAGSRPGTLLAGGLGSLVFVFALTAISNFKMTSSSGAKSGLLDVFVALALAIFASAAIHRVAITLCVVFSVVLLFLVNSVSQARYGALSAAGGGGAASSTTTSAQIGEAKKRK